MKKHRINIALVFLLCWPPAAATAACPPPPSLFDESKKVDTEGALGQFMKLVGASLHVSVANEKKQIFATFPNADQMVVALTMISFLCTTLESSTDLTGEQKVKALMALQSDLLTRATGPRPVASTASSSRGAAPPSPQEQLNNEKKSNWIIPGSAIHLVAMRESSSVRVETQNTTWADIYLNPVPLLITDKNKYFVIVGSATREAEGTKRIAELKSKYPKYDFELYGPYGSNTSYGIMIASWVSRERAGEALEAAKKLEPTSFIWSCRGTGDEC